MKKSKNNKEVTLNHCKNHWKNIISHLVISKIEGEIKDQNCFRNVNDKNLDDAANLKKLSKDCCC